MFTVAVVGPDGAGKSTVTQRLCSSLPWPVRYVYMGVNLESSNLVLPTTRLWLEIKRRRGGRPDMKGPPDPTRQTSVPSSLPARAVKSVKSWLRLGNLMAEEWYRQIAVWLYHRRGFVVVCDRHFFTDYYAHDVAVDRGRLPLARRWHGYMLEKWYPRPDLVLCLDAPAELLFARKGEGTLALLESRRQEYLGLKNAVGDFQLIDASQPLDAVVDEAMAAVERYERKRRGRRQPVPAERPRRASE